MFRSIDLERWALLAAAGAFLGLALAAPGSAARAQEAVATAEKSAAAEEEDEDDELLEPSSTGYVDDATIGTRFRTRYDAAFGADRPDRAEFLYAKCGCFGGAATGPGTGPEFNVDYLEAELAYEHAFSEGRFSLFAELPVRRIDLGDNGASFSGLSDLRLGTKVAVVATPERQLTFQLRVYLPTGDSRKGLGTDHTTLEPGLLLFQRLNDRLTLGAELKYWYPTSGNPVPESGDPSNEFSGDILRYGVGLAYDASTGSGLQITPVAELVGWSVLGGFQLVPPANLASADGDQILNLKLGTRIRGGFPGSFYVGYGLALTNDVWYDDILRFEYRVPL